MFIFSLDREFTLVGDIQCALNHMENPHNNKWSGKKVVFFKGKTIEIRQVSKRLLALWKRDLKNGKITDHTTKFLNKKKIEEYEYCYQKIKIMKKEAREKPMQPSTQMIKKIQKLFSFILRLFNYPNIEKQLKNAIHKEYLKNILFKKHLKFKYNNLLIAHSKKAKQSLKLQHGNRVYGMNQNTNMDEIDPIDDTDGEKAFKAHKKRVKKFKRINKISLNPSMNKENALFNNTDKIFHDLIHVKNPHRTWSGKKSVTLRGKVFEIKHFSKRLLTLWKRDLKNGQITDHATGFLNRTKVEEYEFCHQKIKIMKEEARKITMSSFTKIIVKIRIFFSRFKKMLNYSSAQKQLEHAITKEYLQNTQLKERLEIEQNNLSIAIARKKIQLLHLQYGDHIDDKFEEYLKTHFKQALELYEDLYKKLKKTSENHFHPLEKKEKESYKEQKWLKKKFAQPLFGLLIEKQQFALKTLKKEKLKIVKKEKSQNVKTEKLKTLKEEKLELIKKLKQLKNLGKAIYG